MEIKVKKLNEDGEFITVNDELKVGDGVTLNFYTDRRAATVIEIDPKGKWIKVQCDNAKRIDNNGMSDCQEYEYSRNPNGRILTFYKTRRKDKTFFTNTGKFTYNNYGISLSLKIRNEYYDYSF